MFSQPVPRMLATVFGWLTDFLTGAIMESRKAARSKAVASPPWADEWRFSVKKFKKRVKCFQKKHKRFGFMTFFQCEKNCCVWYYVLLYNGFHTLKKGHKPETFVFFLCFFSEYHLISYWSTSITHPWRFFRLTFIHDFKLEGNWKQCLWKVWVQTEFVMEQRVSCEWTHGAPRLRFRIIYRILAKKSVLEFKSPDKNFPDENLSSLS